MLWLQLKSVFSGEPETLRAKLKTARVVLCSLLYNIMFYVAWAHGVYTDRNNYWMDVEQYEQTAGALRERVTILP